MFINTVTGIVTGVLNRVGFGRTIKKKEIGRACSTYGEKQYVRRLFCLGTRRKGDYWESVGVEERIIWKWKRIGERGME
jgi:hypothetical protein